MEDREVVRRLKGGEVEAYALLVEKYHRGLLHYIHRLVGDASIVEDIGQEVFLDVYRSLSRFEEDRGTAFSTWLFAAARNRCLSELRRRKASVLVPIEEIDDLATGECSAEADLIADEKRQAFRAGLQELSETFRQVLLMSLKGLSLEEIARISGISLGTVKSRIYRAREQLKLRVKAALGEKRYENV